MLRIDKAILDTSGVICDNIARFGATERGLLSQNILGHIRNFVEYVAIKAFSNGADVNPNDYNLNVAALKDMQSVLEHLEVKNSNKDAHLLAQLFSIAMTN